MMDEEEKIPFTSHLEELRRRLIKCVIAVGVGVVEPHLPEELPSGLPHPVGQVVVGRNGVAGVALDVVLFNDLLQFGAEQAGQKIILIRGNGQ